MAIKPVKKAPMKVGRKCHTCSFDCTVTRAMSVEKLPDNKKKDAIKAQFGEDKPRYGIDTCPKR